MPDGSHDHPQYALVGHQHPAANLAVQELNDRVLALELLAHGHSEPEPEPIPGPGPGPVPRPAVLLKELLPGQWVLSTNSAQLNTVYGVQTGDTELGADGNVGVSDYVGRFGPEMLFTMDPWDPMHPSTNSDRSEFLIYFPRAQGERLGYSWKWNFRDPVAPATSWGGCIIMQWHAGNNHIRPQANGPIYAIGRYPALRGGEGPVPMLRMWRKQDGGGDRCLWEMPWPVGEPVAFDFDVTWLQDPGVEPPMLYVDGILQSWLESPLFPGYGTQVDANLPSWKTGPYGSVAAPFAIGQAYMRAYRLH